MGYPGANVATVTLLTRNAQHVVCDSFRPRHSEHTLCQNCAYAVWEHAKFPNVLPREKGWK